MDEATNALNEATSILRDSISAAVEMVEFLQQHAEHTEVDNEPLSFFFAPQTRVDAATMICQGWWPSMRDDSMLGLHVVPTGRLGAMRLRLEGVLLMLDNSPVAQARAAEVAELAELPQSAARVVPLSARESSQFLDRLLGAAEMFN